MGGRNSGRKKTIGGIVMQKAAFCQTVAAIVRETGAKPNTVRSVLRRAADQGEIAYTRFRSGRSSRAIRVERTEDGVAMLEDIFFGRNLK
jgi:predicted transcriptional regulator